MTDTLEHTDLDLITHLDVATRTPCEAPNHAEGKAGCRIADPAAWIIAVIHNSVTPCPEPLVLAVCDGFVEGMHWVNRIPGVVDCGVCGASTVDSAEWWNVIGEIPK